MADTLLFRGGSSADITSSTVQNRELVIDTDTDQIVTGTAKKKTVMENASGNAKIHGTLEFGDGSIQTTAATGGGAVDSVNGQVGVVVLDADDIDDTSTTHKFATSAQLTSIGTAVQPGDLATVATSGSYNDLTNKPAIPTVPVDSVNGQTGVVVLDASDVGAVPSDPTGVTGADSITNMMSLTQAEYDAIGTPNATTLYIITP